MRPHRLIHDRNKPVLNLYIYFRFEFFIRKLDNSLCISLISRLKRILMIDTHKNVNICQIEHKVHHVNKYVNNPTSLHACFLARISLIDEKLDQQNSGRNIILFDVYFGKLFTCNFNIFIEI